MTVTTPEKNKPNNDNVVTPGTPETLQTIQEHEEDIEQNNGNNVSGTSSNDDVVSPKQLVYEKFQNEEKPKSGGAAAASERGAFCPRWVFILIVILLFVLLTIAIPLIIIGSKKPPKHDTAADFDTNMPPAGSPRNGNDTPLPLPPSTKATSVPNAPTAVSPKDTPPPVQAPTIMPVAIAPVSQPVPEITVSPVAPNPSPTEKPTTIPTAQPSPSPTTFVPTPSPSFSQMYLLKIFLKISNLDVPDDESTPQYKAAKYLLDNEVDDDVDDNDGEISYSDDLIQKFVLLVLDFALVDDHVEPMLLLTNNGSNNDIDSPFHVFEKENSNGCEWNGVTCVDGLVTEIRFPDKNLMGSIPTEIGYLENLIYLDLSNNNIYGPIPEELYTNCNLLESLYLQNNRISGTISDSIGNWDNLVNLYLNNNELVGSIPNTLRSDAAGIRPLRYLLLNRNKLTGTIPKDLRLRQLYYMDLGYNRLTGPIPDDITDKYVRLRHFHVDHNMLNGTLPVNLHETGNGRLMTISLNNNHFTGAVLSGFEIQDNLVALTVHGNDFTENLDKDLCKMSVFEKGSIVELKADCDICSCKDVFCDACFPEDS